MNLLQCLAHLELSFIVVVHVLRPDIPSCTLDSINETVRINCSISKGERWNFSLIRKWAYNQSVVGIEVYIICQPGGELVLRRPIKAPFLTTLQVRSCSIFRYEDTDVSEELFFMDYTIQKLIIEDSKYIHTDSDMWKFYIENYDVHVNKYNCEHPPSLREFILRNVSREFRTDMNFLKKEFEKLKSMIYNYSLEVSDCKYTNLKYYEFSQAKEDAGWDVSKMLTKSKLPALQTINISYLMLSETPRKLSEDYWNDNFPALETIDLSHNNLRNIEFRIPSPEGRSLKVDLSYNNILIVDVLSLQHIKEFYPGLVDIRSNPFVCNCSQKDFVTFLQNEADELDESYNYLRDEKCSRPISKLGFPLKTLPVASICGEDSDFTFVLFICISVLLVFMIFIGFIKFRREIRVIIFTRFTSLYFFCLPRSSNSSKMDKDFDAFVSYSSLDETWVSNMCKKLEDSSYAFKLCLHHKHFIPGACISDNIFESVERSRHTIMVLSPNFLQSEWCILEFRKAFHQSLIESKHHLIVVQLESFDESSLQWDMKHFLQTYTYLKASEIFFWERLMYALSHNDNGQYHIKRLNSIDTAASANETKASRALLSAKTSV